MLTKRILLGIGITVNPKAEILAYIKQFEISSSRELIIVTPNPEQVVYAHSHPEFAKLLNSADIALPDGAGLILASKYELKRIPGVELMEDLVKMAAENGYSVGLVGGNEDLAFITFDCLALKYPGLRGFALSNFSVSQDGIEDSSEKILRYFDEKGKEQRFVGTQTFELIYRYTKILHRPLFIFVGLGAPKQEFFIEKLVHSKTKIALSANGEPITHNRVLFMSVGGAFEMLSNRTPRAPLIIRSLGLEWLWRLVLEPWRLRRQFALVKFVWFCAFNHRQ